VGDSTFAPEDEPETRVKFDMQDGKCVSFTLTRGGFPTIARRMG
jgi:hypothetical protein